MCQYKISWRKTTFGQSQQNIEIGPHGLRVPPMVAVAVHWPLLKGCPRKLIFGIPHYFDPRRRNI